MKKLLLLSAILLGLIALPPLAGAKDKHDDRKDYSKGLRDDIRALQNHYQQVKDRVKNLGGDRRQWAQLQDISGSIDRLSYRVDSGDFDPRDVRGRIGQLHDSLRGVQAQLEDKNRRDASYGNGRRDWHDDRYR